MKPIPASERKDPRTLGAECDKCPLRTRVPCLGQYSANAKIVVIGEYPDDNEERFGVPFWGDSGRFLRNMAYRKRISRSDMHITNALACTVPPDFPRRELKQALKCCSPRLQTELGYSSARHVIAFGELAQQSMTGREGIFKYMGGAYVHGEYTVISTLHPTYIAAVENAQWTPIVPVHFNTLAELASGGLSPWHWGDYEIRPNARAVELLRRIRDDARRGTRPVVGFDVENVPATGALMAVGIANEDCGVSVPWDDYGQKAGGVNGLHCYPHGAEIRALVVEILEDASIEKVMHNGSYDTKVMKERGIAVAGFKWDTMLMHAVAWPPLKHTLNHVACQYTHANRWKDEFKAHKDEKQAEAFVQADEIELREYNVRDTLILPKLQQMLHRDLTELHRGHEQYLGLFNRALIASEMEERGVPIDISLIEHKQQVLSDHVNKHLEKLRDLYKAVCGGDNYNPDSSKQTKELLLDTLGAPVLARSNKSGGAKVDKKVLAAYLSDQNQMVQYAAREILEYRKWKKMHGFLVNNALNGVPIQDGVCHTNWKTHGTRTGRWTSPLLILPKEKKSSDGIVPGMRDLVTGFNGNWLVEADYKSLELVVVALLAGDQEMLDIFASDGDIHREVAKSIFKVKDPNDQQRSVVKTFNYGLVYGATDATLWKTLRASGVQMTLGDVTKVRALWFAARPKIDAYLKSALAKAKKLDYIEAPLSGRRYYFYGKVEQSKVYNNPVQMTAADLINQIFPLVRADLRWPTEGILFQYHDAIIIDTPDPLRGYDILKNRMTQEVTLNGCKAIFKVDVEIGKSWQSAESVTREKAAALGRSGGTPDGT